MADLWPPAVLPRTVDFVLAPMSAYGPPATSGQQQAAATGDRFVAALTEASASRTAGAGAALAEGAAVSCTPYGRPQVRPGDGAPCPTTPRSRGA